MFNGLSNDLQSRASCGPQYNQFHRVFLPRVCFIPKPSANTVKCRIYPCRRLSNRDQRLTEAGSMVVISNEDWRLSGFMAVL
jgi:hypothetical protein